MIAGPPPPVVVWHDAECGGYAADLPVWRALAERECGPILDVGAGTGRVALDLAARGHAVTALDRDHDLLAALTRRSADAGLSIATVLADATGFELREARFGLILVPMQTLQLLENRPAFLAAAQRHLVPGGLLAAALAVALEGFEGDAAVLPAPDRAMHAGWTFASQPVAVRELADRTVIERIRSSRAPDGTLTAEPDAIELARLTCDALQAEGRSVGLEPESPLTIEATEEHVGSQVVLLRA
ncbi:MAG: class I SAM-dependent methyltransferase [Solirubrobacterales bacterium]|nr:class I SAM-dependent methyltransferase [Solirubrobacterales bacterium]